MTPKDDDDDDDETLADLQSIIDSFPASRLGLYVLDEYGNPQREPDTLAWARWFETHHNERIVAHDRDEGDQASNETRISVSTVFIGVDHNYSLKGPPMLYETMVFNGELTGIQMRYATRDEALAGHQIICNAVMQTLPKRGE